MRVLRIVVCGAAIAVGLSSRHVSVDAASYAPVLDPTYPRTNLPSVAGTKSFAVDMTTDSQDRALVLSLHFVEDPNDPSPLVFLTRLLADGGLDPTFGVGGSISIPTSEARSIDDRIAGIDDGGRIFVNLGKVSPQTIVVSDSGQFDVTYSTDGRAPGHTLVVGKDGSSWAENGFSGAERRNPDATPSLGPTSFGLLPIRWSTTAVYDVGQDWVVACDYESGVGWCYRVTHDGILSRLLSSGSTPFFKEGPATVRPSDGAIAIVAQNNVSLGDRSTVFVIEPTTRRTSTLLTTDGAISWVAFADDGAFYTVVSGIVRRYTPTGAEDPGFPPFRLQRNPWWAPVFTFGEHVIADGRTVFDRAGRITNLPMSMQDFHVASTVVSGSLLFAADSDFDGVTDITRYLPWHPVFSAGDNRLFDSRPERLGSLEQPDGSIGRDVTEPLAANTVVRLALNEPVDVDDRRLGLGVNATVVAPPAGGYLTIYPCESVSDAPPPTSTVNYRGGRTTGNSAMVSTELGGVCLVSSQAAHVVVDATGSLATGFRALRQPLRLVDSRPGHLGSLEQPGAEIGSDVTAIEPFNRLRLPLPASLTMRPGRPRLALNVTAVGATANGYLTVHPCDQGFGVVPRTSTVNFTPGGAVGNSAVVLAGVGGICVSTPANVQVVVDVTGYFASGFEAIPEGSRLLDTRPGERGVLELLPAGDSPDVAVPFTAGQPQRFVVGGRVVIEDIALGLAINATVVAPPGGGYLTVYPCDSVDTPPPVVSTVNYGAGVTTGGAGIVGLAQGAFCVVSSQTAHVVLDTTGFTI
jgi:hypothetical protein